LEIKRINGNELNEAKKEDLVFYFSIKMQMFEFHWETKGRPFREGKMTKTFRTWLSERNPELLKECNNRENKN